MPYTSVVPRLQKGSAQGLAWQLWAKPSLAAACVTQGTLQIDFGSLLLQGAKGQVFGFGFFFFFPSFFRQPTEKAELLAFVVGMAGVGVMCLGRCFTSVPSLPQI